MYTDVLPNGCNAENIWTINVNHGKIPLCFKSRENTNLTIAYECPVLQCMNRKQGILVFHAKS